MCGIGWDLRKVSRNLGSILGQQDSRQHSHLTNTTNRLLGWHKRHFQGRMPTSSMDNWLTSLYNVCTTLMLEFD